MTNQTDRVRRYFLAQPPGAGRFRSSPRPPSAARLRRRIASATARSSTRYSPQRIFSLISLAAVALFPTLAFCLRASDSTGGSLVVV
jgi:hypothetical protein